MITFSRQLVELKPDEEPPACFHYPDPPDGHRWETDAEFRARIIKSLEEGKENG